MASSSRCGSDRLCCFDAQAPRARSGTDGLSSDLVPQAHKCFCLRLAQTALERQTRREKSDQIDTFNDALFGGLKHRRTPNISFPFPALRRSWSDTARSWRLPSSKGFRPILTLMANEHATARYRKIYAKLLRLYPKPYRERFGEGMEQTFNDLCRKRKEAGEG